MKIDNQEVVSLIENFYSGLSDNNYEKLVDSGIILPDFIEGMEEELKSYGKSVTVPPTSRLITARNIFFRQPSSELIMREYEIDQFVWLNNEETDLTATFDCWEMKNGDVIVKLHDFLTR